MRASRPSRLLSRRQKRIAPASSRERQPPARNTPGLTQRRQTPHAAATFGVLTELAGCRPAGPGATGSYRSHATFCSATHVPAANFEGLILDPCRPLALPHCTEITEVEKRTRFGAVGENHRRDRRTDFFECLHQCHWPGHQEKHTPPLALHLEVCTQPGSLYPFCDFCAMR